MIYVSLFISFMFFLMFTGTSALEFDNGWYDLMFAVAGIWTMAFWLWLVWRGFIRVATYLKQN